MIKLDCQKLNYETNCGGGLRAKGFSCNLNVNLNYLLFIADTSKPDARQPESPKARSNFQ
ncbi:MAG: hypothetical protein EAZ64_00535 [Sphingobacteriales bacterium]|nr:MAG: hypothetical protein EAZ64_00535 [Sphingobacteriales bacterium]